MNNATSERISDPHRPLTGHYLAGLPGEFDLAEIVLLGTVEDQVIGIQRDRLVRDVLVVTVHIRDQLEDALAAGYPALGRRDQERQRRQGAEVRGPLDTPPREPGQRDLVFG